MRQRREHDFGVCQRCVFSCDERNLTPGDVRPLSALLVGGCKRKVEPRVPCDQTTQLPPSVTAGAKNPDRNFMHKECITLHTATVNDPNRHLAPTALGC